MKSDLIPAFLIVTIHNPFDYPVMTLLRRDSVQNESNATHAEANFKNNPQSCCNYIGIGA